VDATEEALAAGFWIVLVAEVEGAACGLSLDGEDAAVRLGEGAGTSARPPIEVVVRGCHDVDLPVEILDLALARHPCTSLSALQARWNKRVTLV
jgi:hypothetical protein